MYTEIRDRLNTIIENDSGLQYGGTAIFQTFTEYPPSLDSTKLPCVLILPVSDSGYQHSGGNLFTVTPSFDMYFYLTLPTVGLKTVKNIEVLTLPDLVATAFLSRLNLQYNDAALNGVSGNLTFRITSNLARLIAYPIGNQQGELYRGFVARLSIPYRQVIPLKVTGV